MFCMGFHYVKVKGRPATPEEARIFVVAPHTTYFDAFVVFMTGLPSCVSRQENIEVPLFGSKSKLCQSLVEGQNGTIRIERYSSENQKGTVIVQNLYMGLQYCLQFWGCLTTTWGV